jgi:hypothetical protein
MSPPFLLHFTLIPLHLHPYGPISTHTVQPFIKTYRSTSISSVLPTFRPMTSTSYNLVPIFDFTSISLPFHLNSSPPPPQSSPVSPQFLFPFPELWKDPTLFSTEISHTQFPFASSSTFRVSPQRLFQGGGKDCWFI